MKAPRSFHRRPTTLSSLQWLVIDWLYKTTPLWGLVAVYAARPRMDRNVQDE